MNRRAALGLVVGLGCLSGTAGCTDRNFLDREWSLSKTLGWEPDNRVRTPDPSASARPPLYARWWFWTASALLVAGVVTTAVLVSAGPGAETPATDFGTMPVRPR